MASWYCRVADCCEPAERGDLCATHRKQLQRTGAVTSQVRVAQASPRDTLREAAIAYADADDGDDGEFRRADDNLRKAAVSYTLREVLTGRPPTVQVVQAQAALELYGTIAAAARALQVTRWSLARALARGRRPRGARG